MAPKTITQRIAINGGQEIEVQLKSLGDAGTTAFKRIKDSADTASQTLSRTQLNFVELKAKIDAVGTAASTFGSKLNEVGSSARTVATHLTAATAVVTALAVGFGALVLKAANAAEAIEQGAAQAQVSIDTYQKLQSVFQLSGAGAESLDTLMARLNKSFGQSQLKAEEYRKAQFDLSREFTSGKLSSEGYLDSLTKLQRTSVENLDVFNRLGVTIQSTGGDSEKALRQVIARLNEMPQGIKRASLEMEIFGRSGGQIEKVVAQFAALEAQSKSLIPPLTKQEVEIGTRLSQAWRALGIDIDRVQQRFFLTLGPEATRLVTAISRLIEANGQAFVILGDTIAKKVEPVINDVVSLLKGEGIDSQGFVGRMVTAFENLAAAVKIVVAGIVTGFRLISAALDPVAELLNRAFGTELNGNILLIVALITQLIGGFNLLFSVIGAGVAAFNLLSSVMALAFAPGGAILIGVGLLVAALTLLAIKYFPEIKAAFGVAFDAISSGIQSIVGFWNNLNATIETAIELAKQFFGLSSGGGGGGDSAAGFAGGGQVRGPGTGTSDSILARLSTGEFVQRAQAVAYYGPSFMNALNQMRIPRGILDGLAGFANGGLVRAMSALTPFPAFASGGMVDTSKLVAAGPAGHPVTLNIGGETFTGIYAEDKTAERLGRYAVRRHVQAAGRKPLWVK